MIKTHTYKVKTNKEFIEKFNQWTGVCRFVYNCALEAKITAYTMQKANLSNFLLQKQLTEAKKEIPWLRGVNASTLVDILERLDKAYQSFFKGGGFPKFQSKKKSKSISFKQISNNEKQFKDNRFYLPSWGAIKLFKDRLPEGKIKTASLVKKADGYYLHINCETPYENFNENQVGVDMGISYFAVTSDNHFIPNQRITKNYERKLRIEQRSLARKKKFSNQWYKQCEKLSRLYLKIQRVRTDFLHKESTKLSKNYGTVFMEDLKIDNMVRNKNLSKHILDCGWGTFKNLMSYKSQVILINPKFTSQKCSECGHTESANRINQSEFSCKNCGSIFNADYNASKNILSQGMALMREREALVCA